MAIELRLATMEDVPALKELIPASVRGLSQNYYTPDQIEAAVSEIFGVDTQLISDGTYFLAEAAGQIAGCGFAENSPTILLRNELGNPTGPRREERDALLDALRHRVR